MKRKVKKSVKKFIEKKVKKKKEFNLKGYIFGSLRKIWRWYPERRLALKLAEVMGTTKDSYNCRECDNVFPRKLVHVDHVDPVIEPGKGFISWDVYIERLFVKADRLQILCKGCHKGKTQIENKRR